MPMARAKASRFCPDPNDIDDIVQESFLQAFMGLDRLRDPERFAGWLSGIVLNVCRAIRRRAPLTLLADWPEQLHPVSADGLPSADDIDRAEALRRAVAGLPAGQRQAVTMYYYADLPVGQIGDSAGAAKSSLHKARQRLREHITAHRPDLIPAALRRTVMAQVRIAHADPRPGDLGDGRFAVNEVLIVLADDAGQRAVPVWLNASDGGSLWRLLSPDAGEAALERVPEQLTSRLLLAAGATVTGVDIDELGPGVTAARISLAGPAGSQQVTARLADGLSLAAAAGAPVRIADTVIDQLGVPADGDNLLASFPPAEPAASSPGSPVVGRETSASPTAWTSGNSPAATCVTSATPTGRTTPAPSRTMPPSSDRLCPTPTVSRRCARHSSPRTTAAPPSPSGANCAPPMSPTRLGCSCGSAGGPHGPGVTTRQITPPN